MESDPNIELALDRIASSNDDELVSWFHMDITEQAWQLFTFCICPGAVLVGNEMYKIRTFLYKIRMILSCIEIKTSNFIPTCILTQRTTNFHYVYTFFLEVEGRMQGE